jgi:hypothetical protein
MLTGISGFYVGCGSLVPTSYTSVSSSSFDGPLTITKGGTYTGEWQSADPNVPAVVIQTSAPVTLQNSVLSSLGNLIMVYGGANGSNVTVTNVLATALNPNVAGKVRGMFLYMQGGGSLRVDHCQMNNVSSGIYLAGSSYSYLSLTSNAASNMDDRESDGNGGMTSTRGTLGHFIIFDTVSAPHGGEIGWNQVINTPGQSSTEDIINMDSSNGGAAAMPIRIHDNYLQGAVSNVGGAYSGGGITTDGAGKNGVESTAFIQITNNQVVETQNNGIFVASGHDIVVENNRVVSSGMDASGAWLASLDNGGYGYIVNNFYGAQNFGNITVTGNFSAMVRRNSDAIPTRVDYSAALGQDTEVTPNTTIDPPLDPTVVTGTMEQAEETLWLQKLGAASVTIGAQDQPALQ